MSSSTPSIGIGFGTTNSSMGLVRSRDRKRPGNPRRRGRSKYPFLVYSGKMLVGKTVEDLLKDSKHFEE